MLNYDFPGRDLGLVSPPHFVYDISKKCFACYIILTDQISLSNCLYFSRYWAICVLQLFVTDCDVIETEMNFIFLIKSFWYMTKKSRQKFKYLENKRSF